MKTTKFAAVAASIIAIAISAFTHLQTNSIKGTVTPADKAVKVWALSNNDTISAPITNGTFEIQNVKAGDYSVIVEAQAPFANTRKKDVVVKDGETTDVGEIKLQQK
ncbi:MAG TPA: carboxypeptidase-like regulatory domain-containing protein [Chitinophagaceae bacterium]|nr:carboxypeptidase-like regulatory domain-containing protein [Chitinophagaceae bacterium]